jgi:hypothetical protein
MVETSSKIYCILEYLEGGELYNHLYDHGALSPELGSETLYGVVSAVAYMHDRFVAGARSTFFPGLEIFCPTPNFFCSITKLLMPVMNVPIGLQERMPNACCVPSGESFIAISKPRI